MPRPEPWERRPGTNRPDYPPFDTAKELGRRAAKCTRRLLHLACAFNCTCPSLPKWKQATSGPSSEEMHRYSLNRDPRLIDALTDVEYFDRYDTFNPNNMLRVINPDSSASHSSQSQSEISATVSFAPWPIIASEPPRIPEPVFTNFTRSTMNGIAKRMPSEGVDSWQSLLDDPLSAPSENDSSAGYLSSAMSLESSPRDLSRSASPMSRTDELFLPSSTHLHQSAVDFDPVFRKSTTSRRLRAHTEAVSYIPRFRWHFGQFR